MADGSYKPHASDRAANFWLLQGVAIRGGYSGCGASDPDERDLIVTPSILSGDIGTTGVDSDNSYTVLAAVQADGVTAVTNSSQLDGFVIEKGREGTSGLGAGMIVPDGSYPVIENCTIRDNVIAGGGQGGGVFVVGGQPTNSPLTISGCTIEDNRADEGGGLYCNNTSLVEIRDSVIRSNMAAYSGGGMMAVGSLSSVTVVASVFEENLVESPDASDAFGGGYFNYQAESLVRGCIFRANIVRADQGSPIGGGGYMFHADCSFIDCKFIGNLLDTDDGTGSGQGGGLYSIAGGHIVNCTFDSNRVLSDVGEETLNGEGGGLYVTKSLAELTNSLFIRNKAADGGGMAVGTDGPPSFHAVNCTISTNVAEHAGGVLISDADNDNQLFSNCILWGNFSEDAEEHTKQIGFVGTPGTVDVALSYCCLEDGAPGDSNIDYEGPSTGTIDLDPLFVAADDASHPNFRLLRCSPAIDASNTPPMPEDAFNVDVEIEIALEEPPDTDEKTPDLDKRDRLFDEPDIEDTGIEDEDFPDLIEDMGAYEHRTPLGDVFCDMKVDGKDIGNWVECYLAGPSIETDDCHAGDMDEDNDVDAEDAGLLVCVLLLKDDCPATNCEIGTIRGLVDCNENGTPDTADVFSHSSADCNGNWIPDECDIDVEDPDGNEEVSNDVDGDGTPDECEDDCNANGTPDDFDISEEASADVNSNDIPDECEPDCNGNGTPDGWDVSEELSEDCDENGRPDECDIDCNGNDVPDACDMDPEDPDGDEVVWEDCNGNLWLDVCDMNLPQPYGSLDCNENGTPDECDIASEYSADCNENGFPDECDIAAEISEDANENGTPDECEEEMMMGGGGGSMMMQGEGEGGTEITGETPMLPWEEMSWSERAEVMEEFRGWCREQEWGPGSEFSGAEQFAAMVDKMRELGMPVRRE